MHKVAINRSSAIARRTKTHRRSQRGQSLVEFALSSLLLILILCGLVDLGRAYFTKIMLDSAVSEGAHWGAAYPGCIQYGTAFNETGAVNVPPTCSGTNSIRGRILSETNQLSCEQIGDTELVPADSSKRLDQITDGDTVIIRMTYNLPVVTPLIQAIAGPTLTLSSETQEVVRGKTMPPTAGDPLAHCGPTPIVNKVTVTAPNPAFLPTCDHGQATMQWDSQGALVSGYRVFTGSGATKSATFILDIPFNTAPGLGSLVQARVPPGGGDMVNGLNQTYSVDAYVTYGTTTVYSDDALFTAICPPVKPTNTLVWGNPPQFSCNNTDTGLSATWALKGPLDTAVAGYQVTRTLPSNKVMTVPINPLTPIGAASNYTNGDASMNFTGGVNFTAPPDWNATYQVQAVDSGGLLIGSPSTAVALDCTYNSPINVNITNPAASYNYGDTLTYTITVANTATSGNSARAVNIGGSINTGTAVSWQCTSASCPSNTTYTQPLNTTLDIAPGVTYTFQVIVTAPVSGTLPEVYTVALGTPAGCSTTAPGCVLNQSGTFTNTLYYVGGTIDLSLSNATTPVNPNPYVIGSPLTFSYNVTNPSTTTAVTGIAIQDVLPASLSGLTYDCYIGGVLAPAGTCTGSFTGSTLNAMVNTNPNQQVTLNVHGTPIPGTTGSISHTATLTAPAGILDNPANNSLTQTVNRTASTDLGVSITASKATYNYNDALSYTVTITNNAASDDVTNAKVTITGPAALTNVTWTCSNLTINPPGAGTCPTLTAGTASVTNATFSLNKGATMTITLLGKAPASGSTTLITSASVAPPATMTDWDTTNNGPVSAAITSAAAAATDVGIVSVDDGLASHLYTSSTTSITYTIVVKDFNTTQDASNVTFTNNVSGGTAFQWKCTGSTGTAACPAADTAWKSGTINTVITTLPAGTTLTYQQTVNLNPFPASVTDSPSVTAPGDTNAANNNTPTLTSSAMPDLKVQSISSGQAFYNAPSALTYTIVVANVGLVNNPSGATLKNTINTAGVTASSWACSSGTNGATCPAVGGSGTGNMAGASLPAMPVGSTLTYTQIVSIPSSGVTTTVYDTASLTNPNDNNTGDNSLQDAGTNPFANLAVTSVGHTGSTVFAAPTTITYTIVITNNGVVNVTGATLKATLQADGTGFQWKCTSSSGCPSGDTTLRSGLINTTISLAKGASLTYTQSVTVPTGSHTVGVTAALSNITPTDGSASDNTLSSALDTVAPDVGVTITDGFTTYALGNNWSYNVVVTNTGLGPVANVPVSVTVPTSLTAVKWKCTSSTGTASCADTGDHTGALSTTISALGKGDTMTFTQYVLSPSTATSSNGMTGSLILQATVALTGDTNTSNNNFWDTDNPPGISNMHIVSGAKCIDLGGNNWSIQVAWDTYTWAGVTSFTVTDLNTNNSQSFTVPVSQPVTFTEKVTGNGDPSGHTLRVQAYVNGTLVLGSNDSDVVQASCKTTGN